YAGGESEYIDSVMNKKVYLGVYTFKQAREMGIGLGLDLKGGMNVILEVSVPDVVKALADHKTDEAFVNAVAIATKQAASSNTDFITLFIKEYKNQKPEGTLAELFATQQLKDKVNTKSTDAEVEAVVRAEVEAAIANSFNVLRTRIDRFGVAQPNIQELEGSMGRIMVELPGIKEPERVRKLLQGSANLEFWETYTAAEVVPFLAAADAKLRDIIAVENPETAEAAEATEAPAAEATEESVDLSSLTGDNAESAVDAAAVAKAKKENPLLSILQVAQNQYCVAGYAHSRDMKQIDEYLAREEVKALLPRDLKLMWGVKAIDEDGKVFELYAIKATQRNGHAPLEGDVIVSATDDYDNNGRPSVSMTMNSDGARRWAALTKANQGRCIAIVLDDNVYSAPVVQNEITGGISQITGHFSAEDTRDLANVLKSGKMPAPAKIVSEEIVGPSLGAESIQQGILSCVIAFVVLMLYMIVMYGTIPGMVANCALLLNLFFTVGILTSFQAALTLSGIAGMVLTLGMAVDANVLIYERTKEELKAGKGVREALSAGYSNALSAILDSNITSLITAVILYYYGTGPIRGFATTLFIGICVSFFTAVFLTRVVYTEMMNREKWLNLSFRTSLGGKISFQNPTYKFMSAYKKSFTVFGVMAVICIGFMFGRGFSKSIDFTGGRNFVVLFEQEVQPETVRGLLADAFPESNTSAIALGTEVKTIRISTNYRIEEDGIEVDSEIEQKLYEVLKGANLLAADLTLENFINRDERAGGSIISSQKVGPSVAEDITNGAIISVILAIIAIFAYILIRFRNVAFSVGATTALVFDVLFILGMYAICWGWMPFSLEIDQTFIGAVLTAIGYSINDKVVVFDRIREYFGLYPKRDRQDLFNSAINNTLNRTINTSVSTFIVLAVIFCLGGASIRSFAFAMILGVVFGTLSSIFMAAPTAYLTMGKTIKEEADDKK
ncbi:MAG: protein translocase subunit SecDF, partial [Bacteroidaceae bacterium]|nr:protein translocase subunit SecDF [Bacteroidaceae bacterium]